LLRPETRKWSKFTKTRDWKTRV